MTALKKAVRTRRGVEPTGRPARREFSAGIEEHERTRPGRSRRELVGRARGLRGRAVPPSWHLRRSR